MIFGEGTLSCGSWTAAHRDRRGGFYETWLLGFVSGYNWYREGEDVRPADSDAVIA
jgi:hypothetical protein